MTTDVPMIHRNEEKHLAAAAARSTQGSPLSVPVFIFLLLHMSYVHARKHTLSHLLYLITTGSFSICSVAGCSWDICKISCTGHASTAMKAHKKDTPVRKKLMAGQEVRVKPSLPVEQG